MADMKYVCPVCGYVYDEEKERVSFAELPESWKCPWCGAPKKDFSADGKDETPGETASADEHAADLERLSDGQISAVFSNLARGCEKQYRPEAAELFSKLADYYMNTGKQKGGLSSEELKDGLSSDAKGYASVRALCDSRGDRGAARICVWGEKVTRMLESLVSQYIEKGEPLLENTQIWVCTVCGFVYIGDSAPQQCPVCRVPARKFEMIEGRRTK